MGRRMFLAGVAVVLAVAVPAATRGGAAGGPGSVRVPAAALTMPCGGGCAGPH